MRPNSKIDFAAVRCACLAYVPDLVARWLPDGRKQGNEWVARNPRRADHTAGSFSVNLHTGQWSDFATGDRGGDIISLAAYLHFADSKQPQIDAARSIAFCLGLAT